MKENFKIKGFIEMSMVDWADKITAMVFLPNCNFKCPYCHNADLVLRPHELPDIDIDEILKHLKKYEGWIEGICITGGEPTLHKWLPDLIRYIKEHSSLMVKLDTNGTNPDMLGALIKDKLVDAVSMDVKAPLDDLRYFKAAGASVDLDDIKRSIDILRNADIETEFRTTIHPKLFTKKDIEDLATQLKGVKAFKLQNFNKNAPTIDPELHGTEPFSEDEFEELQRLADSIIGTK